jgi:ketosteroid isomerase-like protein
MAVYLLVCGLAVAGSRLPRSAISMAATGMSPAAVEPVDSASVLLDGASDLSPSAARVVSEAPYSPLKTAEAFYSAWNHGDFEAAAMQLDEAVVFRDISTRRRTRSTERAQPATESARAARPPVRRPRPPVARRAADYPAAFVGRARTREYLKECTDNLIGWCARARACERSAQPDRPHLARATRARAHALAALTHAMHGPTGLIGRAPRRTFYIDDWAEDTARNRLGLRWHVNDRAGTELVLPSHGVSFLALSADNSLITECTDINEPFLKLPLELGSPALKLAADGFTTAGELFKQLEPTLMSTLRQLQLDEPLKQLGVPLPASAPPSLGEGEAAAVVEPPVAPTYAGLPTGVRTVMAFYDAWNAQRIDDAAALLADDVVFLDPNFSRPFTGRAEAAEYLKQCAVLLNGWQFKIDDWAEDAKRGRIGLKWHVEDASGAPIPLPNLGTSFVRLSPDMSRITEVVDHMQPLSTPPAELQMPLVAVASMALEARRQALEQLNSFANR